jgi:GNAT superfamily N-acetyltransferase
MPTFRPIYIETDAAELARLYNYTVPEPITSETAHAWWTLREGEIRSTFLAMNESGDAIGYWDVDRETWMRPGHFFLKVIVAPDQRCRGLGNQMYVEALRFARDNGATHLESKVFETDTASLKFAEARGFRIIHHSFNSSLDLASFDEHRFDPLMDRLHTEGFHFFSLAEAVLTQENKQKLYEVNRASALDNPGNDRTFPDFYAFSKNVLEATWFRADTQIIASHGDCWVGLSALAIYPEEEYASNAFTGILREYRGRGLAQALKLQTILLARNEGMLSIRTNNDSENAPMLAVNRKLGYIPEPGFYTLLCVLDEERGNDAPAS